MIRNLSGMIVRYLYSRGALEKSMIEVCRYGYEVLLFNLMNALIILILGIILHRLLYSAVFFFIFAVVRQYCGGYHSRSTVICTAVYISIYLLIMLIASTELSDNLFTLSINLILCMCFVSSSAAFAPIENPDKPIDVSDAVKFRKISVILGLALTAICLGVYAVDSNISAVISSTLLVINLLMLAGKGTFSRA